MMRVVNPIQPAFQTSQAAHTVCWTCTRAWFLQQQLSSAAVTVLAMATLVEAPEDVVASLERKVVDSTASLPEKYRVLFSLRNVAGAAATKALITGWFLCLHLYNSSKQLPSRTSTAW